MPLFTLPPPAKSPKINAVGPKLSNLSLSSVPLATSASSQVMYWWERKGTKACLWRGRAAAVSLRLHGVRSEMDIHWSIVCSFSTAEIQITNTCKHGRKRNSIVNRLEATVYRIYYYTMPAIRLHPSKSHEPLSCRVVLRQKWRERHPYRPFWS